ncbi:hypothetical protein DVH05_011863 [Phytophthora capsici]|nr:hypothetical protein DVH05_011863 [Phytophthora capsici]
MAANAFRIDAEGKLQEDGGWNEQQLHKCEHGTTNIDLCCAHCGTWPSFQTRR